MGPCTGKGKQKKRAQPKCGAGAVCQSPTKSETSSKAVLRKDEHFICVQSPAFIHIPSDFCDRRWDRQRATCLWGAGRAETGMRKRLGGQFFLFSRNLFSCPKISVGWPVLGVACASSHCKLSLYRSKCLAHQSK